MRLLLFVFIGLSCIACGKKDDEKSTNSPISSQTTASEVFEFKKPSGELVPVTPEVAEEFVVEREAELIKYPKGLTFRKFEKCWGTSLFGKFDSYLEREFTVLSYNPGYREIVFYVKTIENRTGGECAINTRDYMQDSEYILSFYIPSAKEAVNMMGDMRDFFMLTAGTNNHLIMKNVEEGETLEHGKFNKQHEYGLNLALPYPASVYVEQSMQVEKFNINAQVEIFHQMLTDTDFGGRDLSHLDHYYEGDRINSQILTQILEMIESK